MNDLESHARSRTAIIVKDIKESGQHERSLLDLFRFRPADGDIVAQKNEARCNARALEILIQEGRARLWVVDEWVKAGDPGPEGAIVPPVRDVVAGSVDPLDLLRGMDAKQLEAKIQESLQAHDVYAIPVVVLV
jgi:hypothetical protein